jgi:hypothetical protein
VAECCGDLLPKFQHLVEILPRGVEAVIAAKGEELYILMPMILE